MTYDEMIIFALIAWLIWSWWRRPDDPDLDEWHGRYW